MRAQSLAYRCVVKSRARWRALATAFASDSRGIAAVEFALVLPIMAVLMVGAIEMSQAVSIDRRVSQVAGTVGDLIARTENAPAGLHTQEIADIAQIGSWLLSPFPTNVMRLDISLVTLECRPGDTCPFANIPTDYAGIRTRWRCNYNSAVGTTVSCACTGGTAGTAYTAPRAGLIDFTTPAVVVTTIDYDYTPLFFDWFMAGARGRAVNTFAAYTLSETMHHKPRGAGTDLYIHPDGSDKSGTNACNL